MLNNSNQSTISIPITTGAKSFYVHNASSVTWNNCTANTTNICITDTMGDLVKKGKQFDVLKNLLIQKGILTEQEIDDAMNAMEVMDEMTKEP